MGYPGLGGRRRGLAFGPMYRPYYGGFGYPVARLGYGYPVYGNQFAYGFGMSYPYGYGGRYW